MKYSTSKFTVCFLVRRKIRTEVFDGWNRREMAGQILEWLCIGKKEKKNWNPFFPTPQQVANIIFYAEI